MVKANNFVQDDNVIPKDIPSSGELRDSHEVCLKIRDNFVAEGDQTPEST